MSLEGVLSLLIEMMQEKKPGDGFVETRTMALRMVLKRGVSKLYTCQAKTPLRLTATHKALRLILAPAGGAVVNSWFDIKIK